MVFWTRLKNAAFQKLAALLGVHSVRCVLKCSMDSSKLSCGCDALEKHFWVMAVILPDS